MNRHERIRDLAERFDLTTLEAVAYDEVTGHSAVSQRQARAGIEDKESDKVAADIAQTSEYRSALGKIHGKVKK